MQIIVNSSNGWPNKLSHVTFCPQARMFTHVVHNSGLSNSANRKIILQVGQIIWIWIAMLTSTWLKIDNNIDWILKKTFSYLSFHVNIIPSYRVAHPRCQGSPNGEEESLVPSHVDAMQSHFSLLVVWQVSFPWKCMTIVRLTWLRMFRTLELLHTWK